MIWNKEIETSPREEMDALRLKRLKDTVSHVFQNNAFYKERLERAGLFPEQIKSLDDLKRLPFTTKDDLRMGYPYNMFSAPMDDIVRIHASSGTTGKPTVVGYTRRDIENWRECIARIVSMAGVSSADIAQISFGYGLFTGAFGLHYGLEGVGAAVIPMSSGNTKKQVMIMKDFMPTVLVSTPSYALYMAEVAQEMGIKKSDISLRVALLGGEGHSEEMRSILEERLGILALENYGLSEVMGPGVSGECEFKCGQHINEDHFILEIIDPKTCEPLPEGEVGEVVITTITKEGIPLLRYRTRDLTHIETARCKCGRTTARMAKIKGRSDDMLIIKGVNVFPSQVEEVLLGICEIGPHYQLIVRKKGFADDLEVLVELCDGSVLESFAALEQLSGKIREKLGTALGLDVKVRLVEPKGIERSVGKAKRVVDLR